MSGRLGELARALGRALGVPPAPGGDRWGPAGEIFHAALGLPAGEREAFLERACARRPDLRREVESLLAAHDGAGLLDRPLGTLIEHPGTAGPEPPLSGTVGHYRILEPLGGGGMGVVYRACDTRLERVVALKFLPPHLSADPAAKQRFLMEAQAAAAIDHPNVCTLLEVGETAAGQLFLTMPFYEGETLRERIRRGPLPVEEALSLALQALRGLAQAHARGIVHRDVKPANLVVTPEGVLKILDFGIAKLADVSLTRPGATPGTAAYMSPEQIGGRPLDGRTDLWSVGVVLYEMLAGERPFRGEHDSLVLQAVLHAEPDPLRARRPEVPAALERVVRRALARDPEQRFASALEMARDLETLRGAPEGPPAPRDGGEAPTGMLAGGERRQASVVVCTLSGYAELVEALVPGQVEGTLERLRLAAVEVAGRHGGAVDHFAGDRLVLLFGIPSSHEDDCRRAVRAALDLHRRVRALSAELEALCGRGVVPHTGIDSGMVVVQPAEGPDPPFRVAGNALQTAARLAAQAGADEAWITPECQRLVGAFFATEPREPLALRGREQPLVPHRVLRESGLQTRLEAAEKAGLTAYVGRGEELARLRRCLEDALRGEGRLVAVLGEAGMGKSRLLHEFRQTLDPGRATLLQGRCQSHGGSLPYHPFIDLLREELRLGDADAPERQTRAAVARVREIGPELEEFVPFYLHLLSLPSEELPVARNLQGEQFRWLMQEALTAFLTVSATRRPTVVLLEDWHWADEASQAVLRQAAELAPDYPLLLAVSSRAALPVDGGAPGSHLSLVLQPLEEEGSIEMLRCVLHAESFPPELGRLLHERTGGNPFFLEEIGQTLAEEGTLRVEAGRVLLTGSPEALHVPDTVQAVIRARLDRLERDAREVLRLASVVGREFSRGILERTLPEVGRLPNVLQELKRSGLIRQIRVVPDAAYRFKHALTQEAAYASLLEHQRRELHGRVGKAIEQLYGDRLEEHFERLAHHFGRAEEWRAAIRYGILSAERATELSQFPEALQILERTQGWLHRLPEGTERRESLVGVLLRQERLCETLGLRGRQQRIIDEMVSLLEPAGDRSQLAEVYLRQGDLFTLLRRFREAEAALERSLALRRELDDPNGERNTLRSLGLLRWHEGRNEEALRLVERALEIDRRLGDLEGSLGDLSNLGYVLKGMGEYERARSFLEEALRLSESVPEDHPDVQVGLKRTYILHNLANVHRELRDNARALEYLRRSRELTVEKRLPVQMSYHFTAEAHIHLQEGRVEESLRLYQEAVDLTREARFVPGLAQSLRFLGEVLFGLDRHAEALPHLQEATALFAQLRDHRTEALVWSRIGAVHERAGRPAEAAAAWSRVRTLSRQAEDRVAELAGLEGIVRATRLQMPDPALALGYCEQALELAQALGDRASEGRLRNTAGILEWSQGRFEEALAHYERALSLYQGLGDAEGAGLMLNSIGVTLRDLGRWEEARGRLLQALALHRETGSLRLEGHALAVLGDLCAALDRTEEAEAHYRASLEIRQRAGDRRGEGWMLEHLAVLHRRRGTSGEALRLAERAAEIARECDDPELREACERLRPLAGR